MRRLKQIGWCNFQYESECRDRPQREVLLPTFYRLDIPEGNPQFVSKILLSPVQLQADLSHTTTDVTDEAVGD